MGILSDFSNGYLYETYTGDQLCSETLLEAYFGEEVLSNLFTQFCKFRRKYTEFGNKRPPWNSKINYDPDLIKFNRLTEEYFGYYRFSLMVSPTYDYNAFMINIGFLALDDIGDDLYKNLKIIKSSKGFKYEKGAKVSALTNIYYGLLSDANFTDREIFGIVLHEIGHSFTYAVLNRDGLIGRGSYITNIVRKLNNKIKQELTSGEITSDEKIESDISNVGFIDKIKNLFSNKFKNTNSAIHSLTNTVKGMKKNVKQYGYTNEKFADTFAGMYGYSADVQTALSRLEKTYSDFYKKDDEKIPSNVATIVKVGLMSINNVLAFMLNIKDEHPDGLTRIKVQIEYLERELRNTALDPKMKIDLQKHLNVQRQMIDDYLATANDPTVNRVYRKYYANLYKKYGGDIREKHTDNEALFKTIDDRVDELKESADLFDSLPLLELFGFGEKES